MAEQKEQERSKKSDLGKKAQKKKWVPIVAGGIFENAFLGESLVFDSSALKGRIIGANLMTLTGDMKSQNVNVRFAINEVGEGQAVGSLISYEIMPSSIKRMVRKEIERIDTSFVAETKDGVKVRIKPLLLTKNATSVNRAKRIRRIAIEFIVSQINQQTYDEFATAVLGKAMQNQLRGFLKKVYPMKACEIRRFDVTLLGTPLKIVGERLALVQEGKEEPTEEAPAEAPAA